MNGPGQIPGTILHYQRLSTEDGPGIRTTVFLKGCPLNCKWCHNPESISSRPQVHWLETRCIGCGTCEKVCPVHAIHRTPTGIRIDRNACGCCGTCAQECPANAMELLGVTVTAEEVINELLKDEAYFSVSAGGITLSGGEPTLQPRFTQAVLAGMKSKGVNTALDTCGLCNLQTLKEILPFVDVVLYDLKFIDPQLHRRFTGKENTRILENLLRISNAMNRHGVQLWVRTPIIPHATFSRQNILAIGSYIAEHLSGKVQRWELCVFNNLCRDKYRRLDLEWEYASEPLLTRAQQSQAEEWARSSGCDPDLVHMSGAVRMDEEYA
jgi:pyruvate formate lyase activating enzyme